LNYKKFCCAVLLMTAVILASMEYVLYWVDPLGIWGARIREGVNQCKVKQSQLTEIWKPYECARYSPDIIYIGASKVQIGFEALPEDGKTAYNLAIPGLSLADMQEYLRFAYRIHKPEQVYIGLDFISFSRHIYSKEWNKGMSSFSQKRLRAISMGSVTRHLYAYKDSLPLLPYIPETMRASRDRRDEGLLHDRGWFREEGKHEKTPPDVYYEIFNVVNLADRHFKKFDYAPESMQTLREILDEAEAEGVEVVLFFSPLHVDEHTAITITGHGQEWDAIKREVANMHPVYDFDFLNPLTEQIDGNWWDFVHYNGKVGARMKHVMDTGQMDGIAYLLTRENADRILAEERRAYDFWQSENKDRVELLRSYVTTERKAVQGDFREYIGF